MFVSEQLNRQLVNLVQEVACKCVRACAEKYKFDGEEAIVSLGLDMLRVERKSVSGSVSGKKAPGTPKLSVPKASFPLPYSGEINEACCHALRQNGGLFTQCTDLRKGDSAYCKKCATAMQKKGAEIPDFGTIEMRQACGILEYVDPKGRKPTAYAKIMKKHNLTEEQVLSEARKFNLTVDPIHFVAPEETKRGRPKTVKEPKEKGARGRPKKSAQVVEVSDDSKDIFDELVNDALNNDIFGEEEEEAEAESEVEKEVESEVESEVEKEAKKEAEKEAKEAKKEADRLAKEAKKAEEEAKKQAKKLEMEKAKAEKEAKKQAEKEAKKKTVEKTDENADEKVKKIEFEGKTYLLSKKTDLVYDHDVFMTTEEIVVVGKWNKTTKKIEFIKQEEEAEEEYEEEEEEKEDEEEEEDEYDEE